jgi:hypothetical protein
MDMDAEQQEAQGQTAARQQRCAGDKRRILGLIDLADLLRTLPRVSAALKERPFRGSSTQALHHGDPARYFSCR